MPALQIPALDPGARVQHELLVRERAEKRTNSGDPFVILTLGNSTGTIETAPIWSDKLAWAAGAETGRVVQAIGEVSLYGRNGQLKRQLALTAPLRVLPLERFRAEEFLPSIDESVELLWARLDKARASVRSATLRAVLDLVFRDDDFRVRFERAPGSTAGHHAKLGGLLQHTMEVVNIAVTAAKSVRKASHDLVVAGALLHDVGKVEAYEITSAGFGYTPCGLLLGHVVLGALMLERRVAAAGASGTSAAPVCSDGQLLELQHMILSHHGKLEFGSPVPPMTPEAEIVHWADEASAKATDMFDALEDRDLWPDGDEFSKRVWRLDRRVWRRPHDWD
jgi:3'-5' exoribonuclease